MPITGSLNICFVDVEQDEQTEVSQDQDEAEKTTEEDNDEKKNLIDTPKLPKLTMFDIIKRDYQALFGRKHLAIIQIMRVNLL